MLRTSKQNIVFILTDNLGFGELSVYGAEIHSYRKRV